MSYHPNSSLSDNEFLSYAEHLIDDLTSTELEIELIRRFKQVAANSELVEAVGELTPTELKESIEFHDENRDLISELDQAGITCLDDLETFLKEKQELKERLAVYESTINRIKTIIEEEK